MRRLFILALTPVVLSAWAAPPADAPQPLESARRRLDWADRPGGLGGPSYSRCLEACMDLDRVYQTRQATPR